MPDNPPCHSALLHLQCLPQSSSRNGGSHLPRTALPPPPLLPPTTQILLPLVPAQMFHPTNPTKSSQRNRDLSTGTDCKRAMRWRLPTKLPPLPTTTNFPPLLAHYMKNANRRYKWETSVLRGVSYLVKGGAPTNVMYTSWEGNQRRALPMCISN
jgi:hypothetical protein